MSRGQTWSSRNRRWNALLVFGVGLCWGRKANQTRWNVFWSEPKEPHWKPKRCSLKSKFPSVNKTMPMKADASLNIATSVRPNTTINPFQMQSYTHDSYKCLYPSLVKANTSSLFKYYDGCKSEFAWACKREGHLGTQSLTTCFIVSTYTMLLCRINNGQH